jgi:hypothetical protein
MAVKDPKTKKLVVDEVEIEVVTVNIRNRDLRQRGGHVYTSLVADSMTFFKPGEVKTLQISADEVAEIRRHRNGAWELVATPPAATDTDEEEYEPTSSEASMMAAAAEAAEEQPAGELLDEPPRVQRRTKR